MVDLWPKKNGVDIFQGNYRKAASWLWFTAPTWNISFPGFMNLYFWKVFPLYIFILFSGGLHQFWQQIIWVSSVTGESTFCQVQETTQTRTQMSDFIK